MASHPLTFPCNFNHTSAVARGMTMLVGWSTTLIQAEVFNYVMDDHEMWFPEDEPY